MRRLRSFFWLLIPLCTVFAKVPIQDVEEGRELSEIFDEDYDQEISQDENGSYCAIDDDEDDDDKSEDILEKGLIPNGESKNSEVSQMHLDAEPTAIVNGSVNVITGSYQDSETDFTLTGAAGFSFQRGYVSTNSTEKSPLGTGWSHNYYALLKCWAGPTRQYASVMEGCGAYHVYISTHKYSYFMPFSSYANGATNCGSGMMSSRTNVLNNSLCHNKGDPRRYLKKSSGSVLTFVRRKKKEGSWNLTFEQNPNNVCYRYSYTKDNALQKVDSVNSLEEPLGTLEFTYKKTPWGDKIFNIHSGNHDLASYRLRKFSSKYGEVNPYLIEVTRKQAPRICYTYEKNKKVNALKIIRKNLPNNRFQEVQYYKKGKNDVGGTLVNLKDRKDFRRERVMLQKAPVGPDATPIITHRYFYSFANNNDPSNIKGKAHVYDAHNHLTEYHWNYDDRLCTVCKYLEAENHALYSKDRLYWEDPDSRRCTFLKARSFEDASGYVHFVRSFEYDYEGNVLSDAVWGNLTGKNCTAPAVDGDGDPLENGCEKCETTYTYSDDTPSLVTSCKNGDHQESFFYSPGSDLLIAKLFASRGKIYKREFYEYNDDSVLTKQIDDNGTTDDKCSLQGVTERHVKYIQVSKTSRGKASPVGLPLVVDETYSSLDGSGDCLLKKTINSYNSLGLLVKRQVHDSNNKYLCSFRWEYDSMGNMITEIDPLGNTIRRIYDENKNKISERNINKRCSSKFTYDFSNRLIKIEECYNDGVTLSQHFKYNSLNQKISSTDIYGNKTRYVYDSLGRSIETIYPKVTDENGRRISPKESKEYDALNHIVATTNARGFVTRQENTLRGTPTFIRYPDGSKERFEYNLDGTVHKQIDKNLSTTVFAYDKSKRMTKKTTYSPSGEVLSENRCRYTTFHKQSETDAMGNRTQYFYNIDGKLTEMRKGDLRTTYEYDTIGRLYKVTEWDNHGGGQAKVQVFDLLDRVIEERTEDTQETVLTKISYTYNEEGKRTSTTTYGESGSATTYTFYNPRGKPCRLVDAEGNTTHITYSYDYCNKYGQRVPYSESTDPQGNVTITIQDVIGRIAQVIKKNAYGQVIQESEMIYDVCNNKCKQIDKLIYQDGSLDSEVVTEWSYDSMNRLISTIEASKDGKEKISRIEYNKKGQKRAVVKPDNIRLRYSYDDLGRLIKHSSSDHSIWYTYTYDANNNLLLVRDCIFNTETKMSYDKNDRIIEEILANGLKVKYTYDGTSKPSKIVLPDGSGIAYSYDGLNLKEIQRLGKDETPLYTHRYDAFSQEGKILSQTLIKECGKATFHHDALGRIKDIIFPHAQEHIVYDNVGNITKRDVSDSIGEISYEYKFDSLYQLIGENSFVNDTYEYDSLYNRRAKNEKKCTLNALNELLDDGTSKYKYDSNGNLTAKLSTEKELLFSYDALDRMVEVVSKDQKISYSYDAQNRRMRKIAAVKSLSSDEWEITSTTNYLYLGQNEVGSYDASGKALELRILGIGKGAEIGASVALEIQGHLFAPIHDSIGNIIALINADDGTIEETHRYTAFGQGFVFDKDGSPLPQALSPWKFSSKRYDEETSFTYFGRRYYDSETGRWTTPDPIGLCGGPNLYAYVLNSPLTHFDLYGLYGMTSNFGDWNECASYGMSLLQTALSMPGKIIEAIGFHMIPIPIVRDVIEIAGRFLSGQGFRDYVWSCRRHSGHGDLGLPEASSSQIDIVVGGICTSREDMIERSHTVSKSIGETNIHYYDNSTHGFIYDIMESAAQLVGIRTACSDGFYSYLNDKIESLKGIPNAKIIIHAHSQASIVVNNAQNHIKDGKSKMIDVYTYGAAKLITDSTFNQVRNFVSVRDGVPLFLNMYKITQAHIHPTEEIVFLKSDSFPLIDHAWDGNTYQAALQENLKKTRPNGQNL